MKAHENDRTAERAQPSRAPWALVLGAVSLTLLSACSSGTGSSEDAGPAADTFTIGERIDAASCEDDVDCPPGYACRSGECRQIDNDIDNDGFAGEVDCDDNDPDRHPGMAETCDGIDNNCSGVVDEGVLNACGVCGAVPEEVCDLLDNDCDGVTDEECSSGGVEEMEPNDGQANCQPIAVPTIEGETTILSGAFDPASDKDSYCFFVRPGTQLLLDLDSQLLGANTDGVLQLFGPDGVQLPGGYNDYHLGPDPLLDFTFQVEGTVRLDVYNFENDVGGPAYIYDLNITAVSLVECLDEDNDGVSVCDGDCKDDDVLVFPNQTEVCDGFDNNCDGVTDEQCADHSRIEVEPNNSLSQCEILMPPFTVKGAVNPSKDDDTFCFFASQNMKLGFDIDAQEDSTSLLNSYLTLWDLSKPAYYEVNNYDGQDPDTGYFETDSDSYLEYTFTKPGIYAIRVEDESNNGGGTRLTYTLNGNLISAPVCVDDDADGVSTCEGDCDDADPTVHFGAIEICDGQDNTCDGVKDYPACTGDFDGDGYAGNQGDCNDADPTLHPGAVEVCDEVDNDCDGQIDEGAQNACGLCGFTPPEQCGDSADNDCDGTVDEADCSVDGDSDGETPDQGDCNDSDAAVNTSATEICNGLDDDCDGLVDEYVKNSCGVCGEDPPETCDGLDNNCNGEIDDGVLNSCGYCGAAPAEVCDGFDNDCDIDVDEGLLNACGECGETPLEVCDFLDNDCDDSIDEGCDVDADGDGLTWRGGDCNDADDTVRYGIAEVCGDAKDNDCDGFVDDVPPCEIPLESETNNSILQCDTLPWPGRIEGILTSASDVDYYCFTVSVEETELGFDVDAQIIGSPLDAKLTLFKKDGTQVRENFGGVDPQTNNPGNDPYLTTTLAAGDYVIRVAAQQNNTTGAGSRYQLETLPISGCVDLDGDGMPSCDVDCDDYNASIHPGATDVCDGATVDNNCDGVKDERCWDDCLDDRFKGNLSTLQAASLAEGLLSDLYFCGNVNADDYFKVALDAGQVIQVQISFDHADTDLTLRAYNAQHEPFLESATTANNEVLQFNVTQAGTYYFQVDGPFGALGEYEMQVTISGGTP